MIGLIIYIVIVSNNIMTSQPKPILKIAAKIKPKIIIKPKTNNLLPLNMDSSTDESTVDESSSASVEEISSMDTSSALEEMTYVTPVYGVNMRVSLDNKYIYDMNFNLVGTVIDQKSIQWIDEY